MKWIREHDILLRLFSLLIAVVLWVFVMSTNNITKTAEYRNIPVQLEGLNQLSQNDLLVLEGGNQSVTVRVSGDMNSITNMSREYITVTASVASITEPGEYQLSYRVDLDAAGITLASKIPTQVAVTVDRMTTVSVPVAVELKGTLPEGSTLSDYHTAPDAITVRGPQTVLQSVHAAKVVYDLTDLNASAQTSVSYTLVDEKGEAVQDPHLIPSTPATTLFINVKKNDVIPLTVDIIDHEYLKESMISYTVEPKTLHLEGNPETMRELNQIQLGSVDLAQALAEKETVFTLPIMLPNGVYAPEGVPETATVTVTVNGYIGRTMRLTEGVLPQDPVLEYPEQEIEVRVFGPEDAVAALTEEQLSLVPEYRLEDLTVGENIISCQVLCENPKLYIIQPAQAIAGLTQEALDQNTTPDQPSEPQ